MKITILLLSFCSLLVFSACGDRLSPEEQEVMLIDERWLLQEVNGVESYEIDTLRPNHIIFPSTTSGEAMAYAGCNTINVRYELDGTSLEFVQMLRGSQQCDEMELENLLFEAMENTDGFRISNGSMELRQGRRTLATFKRDTGSFNLPQRWTPGGN